MGQWAVNTLQGAEASGKLDDFITKMFDSLRYFVGILVDFAAGIWNIFQRRLTAPAAGCSTTCTTAAATSAPGPGTRPTRSG
jgi:hypothetical protein